MVLHPDFNIANGHHSNVEFKPAIARYDWHQTYDVLEFVYLPQGFDLLINSCGIPAFERIVIDRFTPDLYLWANNYSDKLFNFLKSYNFSPYSNIRSITDTVSENGYSTIVKNIPALNISNNYPSNFFTSILANFEKGDYCITYLVDQGSFSAWSNSSLNANDLSKVYYKFMVSDTKQLDVASIINNSLKENKYCACSMVISKLNNGVWSEYTPIFLNKPTYLLYSDIDIYFSSIQLLIDHHLTVNSYVEHGGFMCPKQSYPSPKLTVFWDGNYIRTSNQSTFSTFPAHFTNTCYLSRANNNKWKTGEILSDINSPFLPNVNIADLGDPAPALDMIKSIVFLLKEFKYQFAFTSQLQITDQNNNIVVPSVSTYNTDEFWSMQITCMLVSDSLLLFAESSKYNSVFYKTSKINSVYFTQEDVYPFKILPREEWEEEANIEFIYEKQENYIEIPYKEPSILELETTQTGTIRDKYLFSVTENQVPYIKTTPELKQSFKLFSAFFWHSVIHYKEMTEVESLEYYKSLKLAWEEQDQRLYEEEQNA